MKILAFTDIHGSITKLRKILQKVNKNKPDIILCLGDFTTFENHIEPLMRKINAFKKPVYVLPGNHETPTIVKKLCNKYRNLHYANKKIIKIGKFTLVGNGNGGFSQKDAAFERFVKKNHRKLLNKNIILMTHAPPYNTKLDYIDYLEEHVGCKSYTAFIRKYKPRLALSGHIHETFGKDDKIGKTLLINSGPDGKVVKI